jgi:Fe-S cluster assembly iron-binding protein IscA
LALDEPKDGDETFEFDELKFIVEKSLLEQTGGIKVDFANHAFGGGFKIDSVKPLSNSGSNSCGSCSC